MEIQLKNISKKFGGKILLNNFNYIFESGDFVVIFGKSGVGKTTLLNIIGLIESHDGVILYDGKNIVKSSDKRKLLKEDIGFIFQNYGLIDNETVLQNLEILLILSKLKKKDKLRKIREVLKKLGLEGLENRKIYSLSGGEQQRVAIAKLILKDVSVILADEPTASLDTYNRDIVIKELIKLNKAGVTLILVSHDERLLEITDRVINL